MLGPVVGDLGAPGSRPRGILSGMSTRSTVHELTITLLGVEPPVWRRLHVPSGVTLARVHGDIQAVMGWENCHLHQFEIGGRRYGVPDPDYVPVFGKPIQVEGRARLGSLVDKGDRFSCEYDFGDSWEHEIVVEQTLPAGPGSATSRCLEGAGACPPEDVGGCSGYAQFLEALADPQHPDHDDRSEWIGGPWDPKHFNLDETNEALRRSAARRFR
jgi:hypothetical protein